MYTPDRFVYDPGGMLVGSLGKAECEFVGALIIRFHHYYDLKVWHPISRVELADLIKQDYIVKEWNKNPFWRPCPFTFSEQGFILGWDSDPKSNGILTQKFFEGISKRHCRND